MLGYSMVVYKGVNGERGGRRVTKHYEPHSKHYSMAVYKGEGTEESDTLLGKHMNPIGRGEGGE